MSSKVQEDLHIRKSGPDLSKVAKPTVALSEYEVTCDMECGFLLYVGTPRLLEKRKAIIPGFPRVEGTSVKF